MCVEGEGVDRFYFFACLNFCALISKMWHICKLFCDGFYKTCHNLREQIWNSVLWNWWKGALSGFMGTGNMAAFRKVIMV